MALTDSLYGALLRIGDELAGIRQVLELIAAPDPEPEPEVDCPHPLEDRADFGTTDGQPDWQCRRCGFRSVSVERTT